MDRRFQLHRRYADCSSSVRKGTRGVLAAVIALSASIGASVVSAQSTGVWVTVDSAHAGRMGTLTRRVAGASAGHYIVLTQEDPTIGPQVVRRTTDAGATWMQVLADSGMTLRVEAIAHPSPSLMLVIGDTSTKFSDGIYKPFIQRSTDAGATWTRANLGDDIVLRSMAMWDELSGAIVAVNLLPDDEVRSDLLVTTDGFATWTAVAIPTGAAFASEVYARGVDGFVVSGYDPIGAKARFWITSDRGATWQTVDNTSGVDAVTFVDAVNGWGVGATATGSGNAQRDIISRTSDGGLTWRTVIDSIISPPFGLTAIDFADALRGIAAGGGGKILRTTDGGVTWRPDVLSARLQAEYSSLRHVAYPVPEEALATAVMSYVVRFTGRERMSAPRITEPSSGLGELPLESRIAWSRVDGASLYDLEVADTTYEYNIVNHRIWDVPYLSRHDLDDTTTTVALEPRTRYLFRVRARSASDTSDWTMPLYTITRASGVTVGAPSFIRPTMEQKEVAVPVEFEWTAVAGATGYDLIVADNPNFTGSALVELQDHVSTTVVLDQLKPATVYFARVRSRRASEVSSWSNVNDGTLIFETAAISESPYVAQSATRVRLMPNPIVDERATLIVEHSRGDDVTVAFVDPLGRVHREIARGTIASDSTRIAIDAAGLPSGMLFVVVDVGGSRTAMPVVVRP